MSGGRVGIFKVGWCFGDSRKMSWRNNSRGFNPVPSFPPEPNMNMNMNMNMTYDL